MAQLALRFLFYDLLALAVRDCVSRSKQLLQQTVMNHSILMFIDGTRALPLEAACCCRSTDVERAINFKLSR